MTLKKQHSVRKKKRSSVWGLSPCAKHLFISRENPSLELTKLTAGAESHAKRMPYAVFSEYSNNTPGRSESIYTGVCPQQGL